MLVLPNRDIFHWMVQCDAQMCKLRVARIRISTNKWSKKSPLVSTRQETVSLALELVPGWPSYLSCSVLCPLLEVGWRMQGFLAVTWELFPWAGQCPARVDPVPGPTTLSSFTPMGKNCQSSMYSAPSHRPTSYSLFLLCTIHVHNSFICFKAF